MGETAFSLATFLLFPQNNNISLRDFKDCFYMSKNKHLTDFDRLQIQHGLSNHNSIKKIAFDLGKSPTTISREIRKRAVSSNKCPPHRTPNRCIHKLNCTTHYLCESKPNYVKLCRLCKLCNNMCPDYVEDICKKLSFPPYVCMAAMMNMFVF